MDDFTDKFCDHAVEYIENVNCLCTSLDHHTKNLYDDAISIMPDVLKSIELLQMEAYEQNGNTELLVRMQLIYKSLRDVIHILNSLNSNVHSISVCSEKVYKKAIKDAGLEECL